MEGGGEYDRNVVSTRGCNEEIGGSCKEISNDAVDIEDDGSKNQIRDRGDSEEMENADAGETYAEMGTKDVSGYVHVLGSGRKTTDS